MFEYASMYVVVGVAIAAIALVAAIAALISTFFTVEQRTTAIVQRLGKFVREAGPGLNVKVPFIDKVAGRINLRVQQLDVKIETNQTVDGSKVRPEAVAGVGNGNGNGNGEFVQKVPK